MKQMLWLFLLASCSKHELLKPPLPKESGAIMYVHHYVEKGNIVKSEVAWYECWDDKDSVLKRWEREPHMAYYCNGTQDMLEMRIFIPCLQEPYKQGYIFNNQ